MYVIVNKNTDKICSEWSYLNQRDMHICWKTLREIEGDNEYRNDNTHVKKFLTKKEALKFIKDTYNNAYGIVAVSTNFLIRLLDKVIDDLKNEHIHDTC